MSFRYKVNVMDKLKEKGYSSTRLRREKLLGESYMSQIRRGDMISWAALDTVCTLLECQIGDIIDHVADPGVDKTTEGAEDL
jgi:putative transcriptional regulator